MSIHAAATRSTAAFGAGEAQPYEHALRDPARTLHLHEYRADADAVTAGLPMRLEVEKFRAAADVVDAAIVRAVPGPLLDVGCGPGRLVKAAIMAGRLAFGIDVSHAAVQLAQERGLPVLSRSVFQGLPGEGTWGSTLLIDGNIGIGGDPRALLERCAALVLDDGTGRVLVEANGDPHRDRVFEGVLIDDLERTSLPFPWAEVGVVPLRRYAIDAGLVPVREWQHAARVFAEYAKA